MKNEFVSYKQALALKKLGFDELCIAGYDREFIDKLYIGFSSDEGILFNSDYYTYAPLKQQVFRWFREKHGWYANLSSWNHEEEIGPYHEFEIYDAPNGAYGSIQFKTYEEAENACIDKLISIAKQQDK